MAPNMVFILIAILDLIALVLAFVAVRGFGRYKGDPPEYDNRCYHDFDAASGLGLVAMVILLVVQIVVSTTTRCLCFGRKLRPGCARIWAYLLFIASWVLFLVAEFFLCVGSLVLREIREEEHWCSSIRRFVFFAGAVLIFVTAAVSELHFFCYVKAGAPRSDQSKSDAIPASVLAV